MKWKIGKVVIKNQVCLAPMAGVSNPAFMRICKEMGVGYAVSELISSEAIVRGNKKTLDMLEGYNTLDIPVAVQIFGSDAETMAKASKIIHKLYPNVLIDINMGCPVPKVALRAKSGSYLLKDPDKVYKIVKSVVAAVSVPVTVKIRSGWDKEHINAVEIAKVIEKAGASSICIHPRTRSQGYTGKADWNVIKQVKEAVNIPVIGNGDIKCAEDAEKMIKETNCDAVMIGRATLGNPWLIRDICNLLEKKEVLASPNKKEKIEMCIKHIDYLLETKSEKNVVLEIRSHITWYLKGLTGSNEIKNKVCKCLNIHDIIQVLNEYKEEEND